jgi:hypothetical protein
MNSIFRPRTRMVSPKFHELVRIMVDADMALLSCETPENILEGYRRLGTARRAVRTSQHDVPYRITNGAGLVAAIE